MALSNGTWRRHCAQLSTAVLLVAFSFASPLLARAGIPGITIDNFARVDTTYYRGSQPEGRDYNALATLGVKSVINLTSDDAEASEPSRVSAAGMKYFQIPMTTHTPPTPAQIEQFLKIVNDPADQPVYVHCVGGRHRTGVMTAMYRMIDQGWSGDRAFAEMKNYKYGPDFLHSEFKKFVLGYHVDPAKAAAKAANATS